MYMYMTLQSRVLYMYIVCSGCAAKKIMVDVVNILFLEIKSHNSVEVFHCDCNYGIYIYPFVVCVFISVFSFKQNIPKTFFNVVITISCYVKIFIEKIRAY